MTNRDLVTVGASAGGVEALKGLVARLPSDLPASVLYRIDEDAQVVAILSVLYHP